MARLYKKDVRNSHESPSFEVFVKFYFLKKYIYRKLYRLSRRTRIHFTAPSFFRSFFPLESSPFFFFEDNSLPLPGLPEPTDDVGDPEWRWTVGDGALLGDVPVFSGGT